MFIPLYHVQMYEVALSQDELKFRAVGDTYLGDQEGRNTGVRIDFRLIGPSQEIMLSAIELLYLYCKGKSDVDKDIKVIEKVNSWQKYGLEAGNIAISSSPLGSGGSLLSTKNINSFSFENFVGSNTRKPYKSNYDDIAKKYQDADLSKLKERGTTYNKRRPFIMMTKSDVLYKMFLQTYVYRRSVENGMNVIDVNIFLRRYDPEKELTVEFTSREETEGKVQVYNYIEYDDFIKDTKITYDPTTHISHQRKVEQLFYRNKKAFINLERYVPSSNDLTTYQNVTTSTSLYGRPTKTKTDITKVSAPESRFNRTGMEYIIRGIHRMYTSMERISIDAKTAYLDDKMMLDMGLLDGMFKMSYPLGYGKDIITKNLSWLNRL